MVKRYLILIILTFLFIGCRKPVENPEDILPGFETTGTFIDLEDGSFNITGKIISSGNSQLNFLGACYKFDSNLSIMDNQKLHYSIQNDSFTVKYENLPSSFPIYIGVWGSNDNSYSMGNIMKVDSLIFPLINTPCSPEINSINLGDGGGEFNLSSVNRTSIGEFNAKTSSNRELYFEFNEIPKSKIYTTTKNFPGKNEVRILVKLGSIDEYANAGYSVYVNRTGLNKWNIQICDVVWKPFSLEYEIVADINYPL